MKEIQLLGKRVRDKVTGLEGVVTSVSYDLYGCVQALLRPAATEGKLFDGYWFDVARLDVINNEPVMPNPFAEDIMVEDLIVSSDGSIVVQPQKSKGPENKPIPLSS